MRAIGLVLLSIAITALLLTDADAKRRSSAQASQAVGASRSWCAVHPRHGTENCGYTSFDHCWATIGAEGGWCRPNPFPGRRMGPATPGVSRARAAANPPDTSTSSLLVTHEAIAPTSSLADQQNKSSGNDQQSKQNTDDERNNRMPIGPDLFRPSAFLRCSDTQPEEKFVHRPISTCS